MSRPPDASPAPRLARTGRLEVFADVVCPFAYVGLSRILDLRSRLGCTDVAVRVRAWPLELVNGALPERAKVAGHIAALRASVAPDFFGGFGRARYPVSTIPAMALEAAAFARDEAEGKGESTGEKVSIAVRRAFFEEGRDIEDLAVLAEIAEAHGIDPADIEGHRASVLSDWEEGKARGVVGSPHFFAGDEGFFCPSLEITFDGGEELIEFDTARFGAFVEAAFGVRAP